ncbi:MAG: AAA family ATPase [Methylococcaceae bacterium]
MSKLDKITIKGYKSIKNLENFPLKNLNILLGANGAGKSNFISVFKFLAHLYNQDLQLYVQKNGGINSLLHYGKKKTEEITIVFEIENKYYHDGRYCYSNYGYGFSLIPTIDNRLIFKYDRCVTSDNESKPHFIDFKSSNTESQLKTTNIPYINKEDEFYIASIINIKSAIQNLRVYHFHDTSDDSPIKQTHVINDNLRLKPNGENLAAFLLKLKKEYPENYQQIVNTIQLVAPFFSDFVNRDNQETIELEWFEKGDLDTPFKAHILSDGTLRFICLAVLLLQPFDLMSDTVLIDEPELGLHPYALAILADLIKRAAEKKQLIISTQSVELINHFSADDIIIVDRENDASSFKRLNEIELKDWLDDYTLGELWTSNIIGGRPSR